jgi:hypothetical protein
MHFTLYHSPFGEGKRQYWISSLLWLFSQLQLINFPVESLSFNPSTFSTPPSSPILHFLVQHSGSTHDHSSFAPFCRFNSVWWITRGRACHCYGASKEGDAWHRPLTRSRYRGSGTFLLFLPIMPNPKSRELRKDHHRYLGFNLHRIYAGMCSKSVPNDKCM